MSSILSKEKKQGRESMKENNIQETWKDIPGYEGLYKVSNTGKVKSMNYRHSDVPRILATLDNGYGYRRVRLYNVNKKYKYYSVHRLVWEAFMGSIPEGLQINHLNENKADNRLENLSLCTQKENTNYGTRNKRASEKNCKRIQMLDKNNNILKTFNSLKEAAQFLNKNKTTASSGISKCLHGRKKSAYGYKWKFEA